MSWQPPPPPPRPQGQSPPPQEPGAAKPKAEIDYYELLHVDRDAHPTIIRYAYRFLAAMYHPDNGETGDAEKFRIISDAWRTLSDEGKRQAYDLALGAKEQAGIRSQKKAEAREKPSEFGRDSLPDVPKTTLTWNEIELRLAILQVLLTARRKRPQTGGASGKMMMDVLNINNIAEVEFAIWYLREKGYLEMGERLFMITAVGVDYLTEQLSKTQILGGGSEIEQKNTAIVNANLPATLR